MMKRFLVIILLVLSIANISAFCNSQGYILDKDGDFINASRINIICHRTDGNLMYSQLDNFAYGFPFGDWYDDCNYCDLGISISVFEDNSNLYGEYFNESCATEIDTCHSNIYMMQVSEPVSSKEGYSSSPDFGPLAEKPIKRPKSNVSAEEKIPSVKKHLNPDYTRLYISIGIILLMIIMVVLLRKYGK